MARTINKLSDVLLRAWIRAGKPVAKADGGGLTFTLSAGGTAAWILRYRHGGRPRELTLGTYPDLSLAQARTDAGDARVKIKRGEDVALERQREKRLASAAITFRQLAENYESKVMPKLADSTRKQRKQHLKAHILPILGNIPYRNVTPDDVAAMIRRVGEKSTPNVAELVLTATSEVFKHGPRVSGPTVNPCLGLNAHDITGPPNPVRKRLNLSEEELRVLLPNLHLLGRENALAVRIQLATCCRISELARAEWSHIDLNKGTWLIITENSKTRREFTIPLHPTVIDWFKELHKLACGSPFVLPARQSRRQKTYGRQMHYEPRALNAMLNKFLPKIQGVRVFTPHDLRSTARSHLAALGVDIILAERCLNHEIGGLVSIYDKYDYLNERRNALSIWTEFLVACETGKQWKKSSNVIDFRSVA